MADDELRATLEAILEEQRRLGTALAEIRQALRLDEAEPRTPYLRHYIDASGKRRTKFDTAAFFADYHAKNGAERAPTI